MTGQTLKSLFSSFTVKGKLQILDEIIDTALVCLDKARDMALIKKIITMM